MGSSYIVPERENTFLFSLCRTLLPDKGMKSIRLQPAASLRLDTAGVSNKHRLEEEYGELTDCNLCGGNRFSDCVSMDIQKIEYIESEGKNHIEIYLWTPYR